MGRERGRSSGLRITQATIMTASLWVLLGAVIAGPIGFLFCAALTMSKRNDEDERVS